MTYVSAALSALPLVGLIVLYVLKRMGKLNETGPYDPEFAGEVLDCGCDPGGAIYICMHCQFRRCYEHHYGHQAACHAQHRDQVGADILPDGSPNVQRAQPFASPAIVAGADLDGTVLANELTAMLLWHDAGANVCEGAPRDVVRYG